MYSAQTGPLEKRPLWLSKASLVSYLCLQSSTKAVVMLRPSRT